MAEDKLHIGYEMMKFDQKDRGFYDSLTEEEKKKFSPFLMIRWGASVTGPYDLQDYQLYTVNENLNKHFFDISSKDHKKFQWLMATTVSPGAGRQDYRWLAAKKKEKSNNDAEKFLRELYPTLKTDEIKLLASINDKKDLKLLAKSHGWDDSRIKQYL